MAIFASGSGTNAEAIVQYFSAKAEINVELILTNNPEAFVLNRAKNLMIPSMVFDRPQFKNGKVLEVLNNHEIDYIVLAGFLWLVPREMIASFENKIINIHPSLLPKYGGKGMYGSRVHQAVIDAGDQESGITIHLVDEIYDNGKILCQESILIQDDDDPDSLATKIHELEYKFFPKTIENYILTNT